MLNSLTHPLARFMLLAIFAVFIIAMSGCAKESPGLPNPDKEVSENPTPRIKGFIARANAGRSGHVKSGNTITVDSAVWYIEAALNFAYTQTSLDYSNVAVDSTTVICITNTDGMVDESEVFAAYYTAANVVAGIPTQEQHLVVIDANGATASGQLSITCSFMIGSGYEQSLNTTYTTEDDFMWWQGTGGQSSGCPCGDNTNATSYCAHYFIQKRINFALNGGYYYDYWTDVETWTVDQYPTEISEQRVSLFDLTSPDPAPASHSNQNWLLYYCEGPDCSPCLDETDMSFHTQGTYDAMVQVRDTHVPFKELISCRVGGELHEDQKFHFALFSYGKHQRY